MSERPICEICGLSSPSGTAACAHCGRSFESQDCAAPITVNDIEPAVADFGYRPAETETAIFRESETLYLSNVLKSESELVYQRERVLENDDSFYFPLGWIGCVGHLISKKPLRLISFGSYIGPGAHIWAYYEGISIAVDGKDRFNSLKILRINDEQNTIRVLKSFLKPRWVAEEVVPKFTSLPVEINGVDLYFGIRGLLEARANEWFSFEVSN